MRGAVKDKARDRLVKKNTMASSVPKSYKSETHRTIRPSETLERAKPFLETMGITRIANVTGLDRIQVPVVVVTRPNSRSVAVSQGKGLTLEAAKASGVMEAIESWHAERISLPLRYSGYADLAKDSAVIDVNRLPSIQDSRFTPDKRLLWIEGQAVKTGETAWLPYEMVHTDYTLPVASGHGCFPCTSNGLASGNHLMEATCHAICELVERDATSVWHYLPNDIRHSSRIDPDSVTDQGCRLVIERLEEAGFDFAIWETTTDIGIASFHCYVVEKTESPEHIGLGSGCHPTRNIALLRAMTEAVQTRVTYISGARDDMVPEEFSEPTIAEKMKLAKRFVGETGPMRDFTDCANFDSDTFDDDLNFILDRLEKCDCGPAYIVDLTRSDVGIPVVRAIVPGLEAPHDDNNYKPGKRALEAGQQMSKAAS